MGVINPNPVVRIALESLGRGKDFATVIRETQFFSTRKKGSQLPRLKEIKNAVLTSGPFGALYSKLRARVTGGTRALLYEQILDATDSPLLVCDRDLKIRFANRAYLESVKKSQAEVLGKSESELGRPEEYTQAIESCVRVMRETGQPSTCEARLPSEPSTRIYEIRITPLNGRDSPSNLLLVSAADITKQRQCEVDRSHFMTLSELDLKRLQNERITRERFVSTLSHDLRTPLVAARMRADLLKRQAANISPETAERAGRLIIDSLDRADRMLRDLLDVNRIEVGKKLPVELAECDLIPVARDTLYELEAIYGHRFVLNAPDSIRGYWGEAALRRLLENLASNAVKYGFDDAKVTVTIQDADDRARISVHNLGNPISLEDQSKLFIPFHRVETSRTWRQKGWGLGLALVQGIVEAHGGKIDVMSGPVEGTTFTVELPKDARPFQEMRA